MSEKLGFDPGEKEHDLVHNSAIVAGGLDKYVTRKLRGKEKSSLEPEDSTILDIYRLATQAKEQGKIPETFTEEEAWNVYLGSLRLGSGTLANYCRTIMGEFHYTSEQLDRLEDAFIKNNNISVSEALQITKGI